MQTRPGEPRDSRMPSFPGYHIEDSSLSSPTTETLMTRAEILQRLQTIKEKGTQALRLLESKPLSVDTQAEIRSLAQWIKEELQNEYNRMLPKRAQKTMSVFELSVYSPTIEETWKKSGISRLKTDGVLDQRWQEPLEAVVYNAGKYLP